MTGTLVYSDLEPRAEEKTIDTHHLCPGVYYLEVSWKEDRIFKKLIVR